MLALPALTLLATDRRLSRGTATASRRGTTTRLPSWPGRDRDVVISFLDGHRPLVVHAKGDEGAMQALTVIGLPVAQSRRLERMQAATR